MKTKVFLPVLLAVILVLTACSPALTPAGTLPPIEDPTNTVAPQPAETALPAPTETTAPSGGATVEVAIQGFKFSTAELTVSVGTTVTWTNMDSAPHTVTADDDSWGSGRLNNGGTFSFTFEQAGTFAYHCGVHTVMAATVIVTP